MRSLALTIFLIVAPVAVFCVFVARKLMDDFVDDWGVSIMVIAIVFTFYVCCFSYLSLWQALSTGFCACIVQYSPCLVKGAGCLYCEIRFLETEQQIGLKSIDK